MHVSLDDYFLVLRGVLPVELLLQQAHRHLMEICPTCRKEWDGQPAFAPTTIADGAWTLEGLAPRQPPADRDFDVTLYEAEGRRRSRMRTLRRLAREDLARLRRHSRERWPEVVTKATKRYRSHPFLLLLLEEAHAVVRNDPREAAALAKLVPLILALSPERAAQTWAWDLRARAVSHHANALRVAGDLPAAERKFADLRRDLIARPLHTRRAEAEVRSLEASLRIGQRRFAEADRLLTAAAELATGAAASRVYVKHAHLLMAVGEAERALERFEEAAGSLDPQVQPLLHLSAVTGLVNCLCDLDRYDEAGELLSAVRPALVGAGDDHLTALHDLYQARVDLGLWRVDLAEAGFSAARDRFLALDRDYDAVITSLYLADALLAAHKTDEAGRLAGELVPLFQSRGVERETVAALRLLAEAAKAETLTAAVVAEVRRQLAPSASRPSARPAET